MEYLPKFKLERNNWNWRSDSYGDVTRGLYFNIAWLGYDLWFDITLRKPGKKVIK